VLNNMGGFAYRAGRWDEAVELYRSSAEASERAGDANFAAFADCNVGELLSDQGRLEDAEPLLRRALQIWRGTADEHGVAYAMALLGRLHARAGRAGEADRLLDDALSLFEALRAEIDAAFVEVLQAEAAAFAGRADEARELAAALLPRLPGDAVLEPLAHHIEGAALAQLGATRPAVAALEAALAAARAAARPFETVLALAALEQLRPSADRRRERDALLARLDIARLPAPPLVAAAQVG
jgi:hypothetical protein